MRSLYYVILLGLAVLPGSCHIETASRERVQPYFKLRTHQTEYAGPGRKMPEPANVQQIDILFFGPDDANLPAGDIWGGVSLAIEQANLAGGYNGIPFKLLSIWSENPWGTGISRLTRLAYDKRVWAIIGGIDGPSTHLAEQVVAKAQLPLVAPACTDKTVNLANVPWIFSCLPADHLTAGPLAAAIAHDQAAGNLILLAATNHDAHMFSVELQKMLVKYKVTLQYIFEFNPAQPDQEELLRRLGKLEPSALIVVADAETSGKIIAALRKHHIHADIFGSPALGQNSFRRLAGPAAEGVIFPLLYYPDNTKKSRIFTAQYNQRFGRQPDYLAAYAFDAGSILAQAIRKAGLNRARIGDALRELSGYEGLSGRIRWDRLGSNTKDIRLGTIKNGVITPLADSAVPAGRPVQSFRK